jgi:ABC-2 type transport system permease protein
MIRYMHMTPVPYGVYLIGRALARIVIGSVAVVFTFLFAVLVLGLPVNPSVINVPYLAGAIVLGFAGMWAMGMIVAALAFNLTQQAWSMPDAVGGALYLLAGAIFPLTELPAPLAAAGSLLPVSYWLEAMRRGFLGPGIGSFPGVSDAEIFVRLIVSTLGACLVAYVAFTWGQRLAKKTGNLDRSSNY